MNNNMNMNNINMGNLGNLSNRNALGLSNAMVNNQAASTTAAKDSRVSSNNNNDSNNTANTNSARQQNLQDQRLELQRRQKELEFQRQQLLNAMEERRQSMQQMQQSMQQQGEHGGSQQTEHRNSLPGNAGGGLNGGIEGAALAAENSNSSSTGDSNFFVCKFCNSKAYSSARDALSCENTCRLKLENTWRGNSMHDNRRGSLDLLGALAGVTAASADPKRQPELSKQSRSNTNESNCSFQPIAARSSGNFSTMDKPIPLGLPDDKDWLTPLHCFVRLHCVEVFTATDSDVAIPTKGKRKQIQIGQVGIRCPHCHHPDTGLKPRERGSVYYPTSVASIYNATMNLLQRHLHNCSSVNPDIMKQYETLKSDDARSGTSKKYWAESALSLGLIDTPNGIRFSDLVPPPLPTLTSQQKSSDNYSASRGSNDVFFNSSSNALTNLSQHQEGQSEHDEGFDDSSLKKTNDGASKDHKVEESFVSDSAPEIRIEKNALDNIQDTEQSFSNSAPLVTPEDEKVATQFSFYLLRQMQMCVFTEADRLGKRKGLPPGFPGLACRHCFGGYGSGRFFPSSIKTLSDTSKTLNVLYNHMMRCRKCPMEVRETLEKLRKVHDEQRAKMKFGSQKAFFARIWDRLHDNDPTVDSKKRKFQQPKKKKKEPPPPPLIATNFHQNTAHSQHQESYLDAANAFTGGLAGLSTAGFANRYGGFLQGNNVFNNSVTQYTNSSDGNKRLKMNNLAQSHQSSR